MILYSTGAAAGASGAFTASGYTMTSSRLLGRTTASTGAPEELTVGTSLTLTAGSLNTTQGLITSSTPQFAGLKVGGTSTTGKVTIDGSGTTTGIAFAVNNSGGINTHKIQDDGQATTTGSVAAIYANTITNGSGTGYSSWQAINNIGRFAHFLICASSVSTAGSPLGSNRATLLTDGASLGMICTGGPLLFSADAGTATQMTFSVAGGLSIGTSTDAGAGNLRLNGGLISGAVTLMTTTVALTNGAAAALGSLTNAPSVGDPTKWIPINDNGTTRYIPAW